MTKLVLLENKYLLWKASYYNGTTLVSDDVFNALEDWLKEQGSNVVKQVGHKIKDYDFKHPSPMLSLDKIQTKRLENDITDYMVDTFYTWLDKRLLELGITSDKLQLEYTYKFDGNAINIVYTKEGLLNVISRGKDNVGNDLTERISQLVPSTMESVELGDEDYLEIRCEVVIKKSIFEEKYANIESDDPKKKGEMKYANPRNFVAGVLNKETMNLERVNELTIKPIHYILNGEHIDASLFDNCEVFKHTCVLAPKMSYEDMIKMFEANRESDEYLLDGVVIAFPNEYRTELGENSHDPEWSIAIKFLSELATTNVIGLDWSVGKTGELTPVGLLEAVLLMGSTVRRTSCYNLGYILENKIGKGARVVIRKSGDIIPEIVEVIVPADGAFDIIDTCPACGGKLDIEGVHLMCNNEDCAGRKKKQFESALRKIDIKGVGAQTLAPFHSFNDLIDIITWVRENDENTSIEEYGLTFGSRSHENFVAAFKNIYDIPLAKMITALGYAGVGDTISTQVANMYAEINYDFKGLTKELIHMFEQPEMKELVFTKKKQLEDVGIVVSMPEELEVSEDTLFVVLTGSPKTFGFKTKGEFLVAHPNMVDVKKLSDKRCNMLITDDVSSTTKKMGDAEKKGIPIKTYGDF